MRKKQPFVIRTALALFLVLCSVWGWGQTFTQVTDLASLTSGKYLIVGDGSNNDGLMLNSTSNGPIINYTPISNPGTSITSGYIVDNIFTVQVTGTATKIITINHAGVGYVSWGNTGTGTSNNAGFFNGSPTDNERWTATVSSNLWTLANVAFPGRMLQWNNSSPRFAAYTTNQVKLKFYKLEAPTCTTAVYDFDQTTVNKTTADAPFTNMYISDNTSPEVYSSSDTSVATVNETTGEVTIAGVGTTTITVTQVADGNYCEVDASYTLNVTCLTPVYDFDQTTVNKTTADAPFINMFISENTSPEVYSSSDTNVATVDASTGEVTLVGAGTATITVTQVAAPPYCALSADYTLNVTSAAPSLSVSGTADNGSACLNTAAAVETYTITNAGNSAAAGLTVVSDNAQFVVSNISATTVAGSNGTVTFDVTFTPTSAGIQNATITVESTTSGSNTATFDVTGTGTATADPVLSASAATAVTDIGATLNGEITSLGTCLTNPITEKGFVYGTSPDPVLNGGNFIAHLDPASTGAYNVAVTLSPATQYYYKAYVVDGTGQYYFSANEETFTTTLAVPVATAASNITHAGFTANWNAVTGADAYVLEVNEVTGSVTPNVTVVGWDFEDEDATADLGISANSTNLIETNATGLSYTQLSGATGYVATTSGGWNNGANTKYWQVSFTTAGMNNMKFSSAQRSSNTGPKDFKVQYSLNGSTWIDIPSATVTVANNWTTGVLDGISLPTSCDNQPFVYLRWIMTSNLQVNSGNVAAGGTSAIDNVIIIGNQDSTTIAPISGSPFAVTAPATSYNVTGLNPDSDYTYAIKAVKGTVESAVSNTIDVTTGPAPVSTTYAGGTWTDGAPNSPNTDAVISEDYNGAGFTAKDITVSSGAALTIGATETITAANMIVEDDANLIQEDGSTLSLSGTLRVNKNASSAADKYVFWSSPVQNQNVYDIYPAGTPQFVMTYDSNTDLYPTVADPTIAAQGIGYSVKVPSGATAAEFTGTPNSGNVNVTLDNVANANGNTWNLIGNPYPSNLNLQTLYDGGLNGIDSSIYFWDNITATNTQQQQAATTWAVFNAANGTWSATGASGLGIDGNNNLVKPGQGFIVRATAPSITFTNAMRTAAAANFINKGMNPGEGKFWLKLTTPAGTQFQTAITYGGGALNTLEAFDSKVMSVGANGIYSYLGTDKLAIQGRDYFVDTDVVIIGNKHSASGQYTFSLAGKTGLFDAGQAIYLKDKQTNIYTNLQTDSYTFLSDALEQQDRFEIVYQPQAALGTAETVKTETVVYKDGDHFTVKASEKILSIEVYDASGRHIGTVKPDSTTAQVTAGSRGMYLLKIKTVNSETVKKVIK